MKELNEGETLDRAAIKAGMSENTARRVSGRSACEERTAAANVSHASGPVRGSVAGSREDARGSARAGGEDDLRAPPRAARQHIH